MCTSTATDSRPEPVSPSANQRYFRMDDGISYTVVARDLEHAKDILRSTGMAFSQDEVSMEEAEANGELEWREMTEEQVMKTSVYQDDGATRVPLCSCKLGDWFSSEW